MMTTKTEEIGQELRQLNAYLLECERRIHKGEILDMSNFDEKTKILCRRLMDLPEGHARSLAPELETLISRLDRVAEKVRKVVAFK